MPLPMCYKCQEEVPIDEILLIKGIVYCKNCKVIE